MSGMAGDSVGAGAFVVCCSIGMWAVSDPVHVNQ